MTSNTARKFDSVACREEWGGVDGEGFHLHATPRATLGKLEFGLCSIDGQQIAVFIDVAKSAEIRASLASRKPDWVDATVCAEVVSSLGADVAVIDAEILNPGDAELETGAFATACIAFGAGSFTVVPSSYCIRFGARGSVRVTLDFDDESASWFGKAEIRLEGN